MLRRVGPLSAMVLLGTGFIDEREFRCEEAVQQLGDCCAGVQRHAYNCEERGCGGLSPDFSLAEAQLVASKSCSTLVSDGTCSRSLSDSGKSWHCTQVAAHLRSCCTLAVTAYECSDDDITLSTSSDRVTLHHGTCLYQKSCEQLLAANFCEQLRQGTVAETCP